MRIVPGGNNYSTATLRSELVADLAALRAGQIGKSEARTRAYLAKQIIDTMKIDIVAANMRLEQFEPVELLEAA